MCGIVRLRMPVLPHMPDDTFLLGGDLEVVPPRLRGDAHHRRRRSGASPRTRPACRELLRHVVERDVNLIDTADSYGPEVSENLIAEALRPYPENLVIATKGGLERSGPGPLGAERPARSPAGAAARRSLRRLRARADRPLPAPHGRPEGADRGLGRRAGRASGGGQDPPHRRVQRRPSRSSSAPSRSSRSSRSRTTTTWATAPPRTCCRFCEEPASPSWPISRWPRGDLAEPGSAVAEIASRHGATPGQVALAWLLAALRRSPCRSRGPARSRTSTRTARQPSSSSRTTSSRRSTSSRRLPEPV